METASSKKAFACGIGTIFIMGCLYFFGIPLFFVGISFLIWNDGDDGLIAGGAVSLVLAIIFLIAGIVMCVFTIKYGNKASAERRQQAAQTGVVHGVVVVGPQNPVGPANPVSPPNYTYTAGPPATITGSAAPPSYPAAHNPYQPQVPPQYPAAASPYPPQASQPQYPPQYPPAGYPEQSVPQYPTTTTNPNPDKTEHQKY